MNWKVTVGLAVVLCILVGVHLGLKKRAELVEEEEVAAKQVYQVERDDITELKLAVKDEDEIIARKKDGEWTLVAPVDAKADTSEIERIVREFVDAKKQETVDEDAKNIGVFGLAKPGISVGVKTADDADEHVMVIGDQNPTKTYRYAAKDGDSNVFLLSNYVYTTFNKTLKDLRDKHVMDIVRADVNMMEIARGNSIVKLEKNGEWFVREPIAARADEDAVTGILDELESVLVEEFVSENPENLDEYGLADPAARFTVYAGDEQSAQTILFGSEKDDGTGVYAKRDVAKNVVLLKEGLLDTLPDDVDDIRNHKLVVAEHTDLKKIEYVSSGGSFTLAVDDTDGWYIEKPDRIKADTSAITDLFRTAGEIKAEEFFVETPAGAGFAGPRIKLAMWYKTDKDPVTVLIGVQLPDSDLAYAQTEEGETVTVSLTEDMLDSLNMNLFDLRDKVIVNFSTDDVDHIETAYLDRRVDIERKDDEWAVKKPDDKQIPSQFTADELVRSINYLQMKDMVTAAAPDDLTRYGLDDPMASFTVHLKDGTVIGPVNIGDESGSSPTLFNAVHTGKQGIVLIEKTVVDSMRQQIADIVGDSLPSVTTATRERMTERVADKERAAAQNTDK